MNLNHVWVLCETHRSRYFEARFSAAILSQNDVPFSLHPLTHTQIFYTWPYLPACPSTLTPSLWQTPEFTWAKRWCSLVGLNPPHAVAGKLNVPCLNHSSYTNSVFNRLHYNMTTFIPHTSIKQALNSVLKSDTRFYCSHRPLPPFRHIGSVFFGTSQPWSTLPSLSRGAQTAAPIR